MAETTITNIKDAFKLFEDNLKIAVATLAQQDQIGLERLSTLDNYTLKHPRGVYGLIYNGDVYQRDELVKSNTVKMKEDLMIGVVSIIRFFDNPNASVSDYPMMPGEYPELAVDTLSGLEIFNNRPEYERRVIPVRTELVDETNGIWKYLTTFLIPRDFIKS